MTTRPILRMAGCDLLGCRHPVLQAGMGGVARADFAAATDTLGNVLSGRDSASIPRERTPGKRARPIYLMSTDAPLRSMTGDLARMALFAQQNYDLIDRVAPAAEVVAAIWREADSVLATLAGETAS